MLKSEAFEMVKCLSPGREEMRRTAFCLAASFAVFGWPGAANAAVLIKTFHVAICVTGEKHPDGCKNVAADGHVVVSDDAME